MQTFKRIFVIVADSVGVGAAKDAHLYGDNGSNTLKHLSFAKEDFKIPVLESLGIGHLTEVNNTAPIKDPIGSFGTMAEISVGKDTLTGHFELMGLEVKTPFPSFTETGFPEELITELESRSGYKFIGNIAASGTEIIKDLGEQQLQTKELIIYTSSDSVLQIAANEEVIPLQELYRVCEIARKITIENNDWMVGRVIARPFIGNSRDTFTRTANRHDYALKPFGKTTLDFLKKDGHDVIAVGKIFDIFDGEGITKSKKTISNLDGMAKTIALTKKDFTGLAFVNLVDFDAVYGHRRNAIGYAKSIEEFDLQLKKLIPLLKKDDLLIICADHGNDPTFKGTDHTREDVPLLVYNKNLQGINLGKRTTFADVGATICDNFQTSQTPKIGTSFLQELKYK